MDDIRFGIVVRTSRIQRGWRQRDLARAAGVSDAVISRVERGHLDGVTIRTLRAIAAALEISVELVPRSRSANIERLANAKHAWLAEAVVRWLGGLGGWVVRPEVSFSRFGERGVIDLLAWHPGTRSLLVIELKTAIVDVGELLGTLDRKVRNAWEVARGLGWDPLVVGSALIVADGSTNRRRIGEHAATFRAPFPDRIAALRRWLADPVSDVRAIAFFADRRSGQVVQRFDHRQRVSVRRGGVVIGRLSLTEHEIAGDRPANALKASARRVRSDSEAVESTCSVDLTRTVTARGSAAGEARRERGPPRPRIGGLFLRGHQHG